MASQTGPGDLSAVAAPARPLLELAGIGKAFGGLQAVWDVSFAVYPGEIFSVIGPNGAGKTTIFNLVTGIFPPSTGKIRLSGRCITGMRPHQVARLGVARTFQTTQVFAEKTVLDNVLVGRHARIRSGIWQALLRPRSYQVDEEDHRQNALATLELVGLQEQAGEVGGRLPTALQQRLAIAMALAGEPDLLLLDEPTGGLMEHEVSEMMQLVRRIRDNGVTVVLIEHKMRMVMRISDRIAVLSNGQKICEGTPAEVVRDQRVVEAYLGAEYSTAVDRT